MINSATTCVELGFKAFSTITCAPFESPRNDQDEKKDMLNVPGQMLLDF